MSHHALNDRLRSLREAQGLTKKDLASDAWMDIGTYNHYELRCTVEDLLTEKTG